MTLSYPPHFPAFIQSLIESGHKPGDVRYCLEKPWKYANEYTRFAAQAEGCLTRTVNDLAGEIGVSPADVVDLLAKAGVTVFWIEGNKRELSDAREAVLEPSLYVVEVDLTPVQVAALVAE